MSLWRHALQIASDVDLKKAILVGLDEAFTALEEALHDLSDAELCAFPVPGQNNMAWIVMHCLENLDEYANGVASGERAFPGQGAGTSGSASPRSDPSLETFFLARRRSYRGCIRSGITHWPRWRDWTRWVFRSTSPGIP